MKQENHVFITLDGEDLIFHRQSGRNSLELGKVKIEWNYLVGKFVHRPIPTEAEVEYAINYIEDELMKDPALVNSEGLELYCASKELAELLDSEGKETEYTKQEIEELFTPYALLSMGRSPVYDDLTMNGRKYMALLVVREIVNHLNFESIHLEG